MKHKQTRSQPPKTNNCEKHPTKIRRAPYNEIQQAQAKTSMIWSSNNFQLKSKDKLQVQQQQSHN